VAASFAALTVLVDADEALELAARAVGAEV
jgi:hypothetical protein